MVGSRVALRRYGRMRHPQVRCVTRLKRRDHGSLRATRLPRRTNSFFGGGNSKDKNGDADKNPFSNFSELLKTAQDAQARASVEAQRAQEELSKVEFEGYDEDEMVRVVVTGNQEPKSVELTESVLELEQDEIQKHLVQAMKDAHSKSVMVQPFSLSHVYSTTVF